MTAISAGALPAQQGALGARMLRAGVILALVWEVCHPVPASAAPCTAAVPLTQPCDGVLVPVADLLACGTDRADLAACLAHRERERQSCEALRAIDAEAAEVREWTLRRERDAARARADAMAGAGTGGPSWWTVAGVGAVGVAVGVVVGVLVSR